jgi:hypothetical protein
MTYWKRLKRYSLALIAGLALNAQGLETDQYMCWGKTLRDASQPINLYLNTTIYKGLEVVNSQSINQRATYSCEDVHEIIVKTFNAGIIKGIGTSEIETLIAKGKIPVETWPPSGQSRREMINASIYAKSLLFKMKIFGVSINVNNIYFGTDKLDHIISTGYAYYRKYTKRKRKGHSHEAALKHAMNVGIRQEKTYYGKMVSGVFSYADLEANYQGLRMHQRFCQGHKPYLAQYGKHFWRLAHPVDLHDYITPYFDESWNNNAYTRGRFKKTVPLLRKYCKRRHLAQRRFGYYAQRKRPHVMTRLLQRLRDEGKVPDNRPQSLDVICTQADS